MYSYKFSDDESKQIEEKTQGISNVLRKFKEIDEKFDLLPSVKKEDYEKKLELKKQEFTPLSEDEVVSQAQNSLHEFKDASLKQIENDYALNKEKLENQEKVLQEGAQEAKENLSNTVDKLKTDASNDAIKRGLARSSIIVNKLASYDAALITEFAKIEKDYMETTQKLAASKSLLEVQRQNALDSFDIAYAVKVSQKINDINEKLADKEREVIEYNNKLIQIEQEYEAEMLEKYNKARKEQNEQVMDYADFVQKGGDMAVQVLKLEEKFKAAQDYLMSLPKEEALKQLFENEVFKTELKSKYQTLLNQINAR